MLIRDIMRSPVITISPGTTLQDAYRIMQEKGIRHLPVLAGKQGLRSDVPCTADG
jgi:acetoin utilization protein AcuB